MYAYFIDDWVYQKQKRFLDKLDVLTTQQGVSGRKIRLSRLSNIPTDMRECLRSGIKTFVAVGNDATASRILNQSLVLQQAEPFSLTFAVVPVAAPSEIARLFNVPNLAASVNALAAHKIRVFDVGCLNKRHYFLTAAVFPKKSAFRFRSYTVSSRRPDHHISVCNSNIFYSVSNASASAIVPDDGILDAIIAHRSGRGFMDRFKSKESASEYIPESFFPIKKITVKCASKTVSVFADAEKQLASPVEVEVVKGALTAIVSAVVR